jgi:hypothetical protein
MERRTITGAAPRSLPGRQHAEYELDESLIAVHGAQSTGRADSSAISLEGGEVTVRRADRRSAGPGRVGPVYRAGAGGPIAVPTGRVFVRFTEGVRAEGMRGQLADAGFPLESVPSYAPDTAWVRPASGQVVDALRGLDALRRIADVADVEPQFVSEAAPRR